MAAVGSAVGLGNVWRYPYICYKNGGGAFLLPYIVALFTAGIPLLILEFTAGHWARKNAPETFKKVNSRYEWAGWWTSLMPFVIALYYVVVMAWCFAYVIYAADLRWGTDAEGFFKQFLGDTGSIFIIGSISIPVVLALMVIWFSVFFILYKGIDRIGKVVYITVPLPWILLVILGIRGLTLPGAIEGVAYYLTPDFSKLVDANVWLAAYAQVFFSLSLAQGIMITYAAHLKRKSDLSNNAFIVALADAGTSFFAGFAVFSIVGYLAVSKGFSIEMLANKIGGPNLSFITYPTAISLLPVAAAIFGVIFFIALLTFAIDSAFSMVEPLIAGVGAKWRLSKTKATALLCGIGFFISLSFCSGNGIYLLDLVDHFVANFCLVLIGLIECIIFGWMFPISKLREHANKTSDIMIGKWWDFSIKYLIPLILSLIFFVALAQNIINPYNNYPGWVIICAGVLPIVTMLALSFLLARTKVKGENQ